MSEIVERALAAWGMRGASFKLAAARENAVYEVLHEHNRFALRLHRQGYRSDAELASELAWMAAMAAGGLTVPEPVPSPSDQILHRISGYQIDVLTWLTGKTMAETMNGPSSNERYRLFFSLGQNMARLHQISDTWRAPPEFDRVHWNLEGLLGETPVWGRFWENPHLTKADRDLFEKFRNKATANLTGMEQTLDYGLIHADLVPANVLVDGNALKLIDFDDGGFGYRLFDVATALLKHITTPDYPELQNHLIAGYRSQRSLNLAELDFFLALRAATYVGWNITRMGEEDGMERNARFIKTLRSTATRYLHP